MNTSAAIAAPLFRLRRACLVKREARFPDDARLSASPRGARAQDGKNVSVSGILVCEMRETLHEQCDPMRFRPLTPQPCSESSLSGVEGSTVLGTLSLWTGRQIVMGNAG
jgi:hypothetical protein